MGFHEPWILKASISGEGNFCFMGGRLRIAIKNKDCPQKIYPLYYMWTEVGYVLGESLFFYPDLKWLNLSSEKKKLQVKQPGESSGWHLGSSEISGAARHFTPSGGEWKLKQRGLEPCMMFSDFSPQIWGSNTVDVSEIRLKLHQLQHTSTGRGSFKKEGARKVCCLLWKSALAHTSVPPEKKQIKLVTDFFPEHEISMLSA